MVGTTQARVKVEAVDNVFFDVSNADFAITDSIKPTINAVGLAGSKRGRVAPEQHHRRPDRRGRRDRLRCKEHRVLRHRHAAVRSTTVNGCLDERRDQQQGVTTLSFSQRTTPTTPATSAASRSSSRRRLRKPTFASTQRRRTSRSSRGSLSGSQPTPLALVGRRIQTGDRNLGTEIRTTAWSTRPATRCSSSTRSG